MSLHITTDPADFSDWPALLALLQQAFAFMDGRIDPPSSLQGLGAEDLRAKAGREHLILAREHGQLLGCAYADLRPDRVYVGKVAVAPAARRRGIARQLLAAAEALARQAGRPVLELQTRIELVENQQTFIALGFVPVAATAHPGFSRPTSLTLQRRVGSALPGAMRPRLTLLTLGVDDLPRAVAFYRDGLGWPTSGIVGTEFEHGAVAFFQLQAGLKLALWPRSSLAADNGLPLQPPSGLELSLGHNLASPAEVDAAMSRAAAAGARIVKPAQPTFYGGYAGCFQDPDGHLWEVAHNPGYDAL